MTGSLKVKNGIYYAVINYKDNYGKYKQKWITTGLKERGNKKEAQKFLKEQLDKFNKEETYKQSPEPQFDNDILFVDYVAQYIEDKKEELSPAVYYGYRNQMKVIKAFFGNRYRSNKNF